MSVPLAIGVTILAALGPAVANGFVNDDAVVIVGNSRAHDPSDLGTIFSSPYWTNTLYRPVTVTAFAILWRVGGGIPLPYMVTNLVLMVGVCLLLYRVLVHVGASRTAALVATLLFAVHPVHVEVVANGVGLAELLSTGFLLCGAALTVRHPWPRTAGLMLGACGLLAFLSKESGITGLALIPLLWYACSPDPKAPPTAVRRTAVLTMLLFLVVGLAVRTTILGGLNGEAPIRALAELDTMSRARTVLGVVPEWVRLLLWPASLQADYGPPQIPIGGPFGWRHVVGVAMLSIWGTAFVMAVRRRARLVAAGLLWVPIALSPVSNLLFPTGILLAERTLFLPSVGMALIAAGAVDALPRWRTVMVGAATVLVVLGGLRSRSRVGVWHDQETFFEQIITDAPRSYRSWYMAGLYARQTGHADDARRFFAASWELEQRDYEVAEEYGQLLRADGDLASAVVVLGAAFRVAPNEEPLTSRLLESLMALERWDDAEALIAKVQEMSPEDAARLRARLAIARDRAAVARAARDQSPDPRLR